MNACFLFSFLSSLFHSHSVPQSQFVGSLPSLLSPLMYTVARVYSCLFSRTESDGVFIPPSTINIALSTLTSDVNASRNRIVASDVISNHVIDEREECCPSRETLH